MDEKHPLQVYRESFAPPMKRAALARLLEVARPTVKRWESGERDIDEKLLARVTEKTGIPAKELRPDLVEKLEELLALTGVAE